MTDRASILVVDDSAESLALLVRLLSSEGYEVRPADSGELALAAAAAWTPQLILLDIRMPGMDGLEVCRRLKADKATRRIPVILVSGGARTDEWVEGLKIGAADYITKPYQAEELRARVRIQLALEASSRLAERQAAALQESGVALSAETAERVRVERALRDRDQFYRDQFDHNPMVTLLVDPTDGQIVEANAAAVRYYGHTRGQLLSMRVTEINGMSMEKARGLWDTVLREGGTQFETPHRLADGAVRLVHVVSTPVQFDGRAVLQSFVQDITEQRRAEEALRDSERDLREAEHVAHVGHWQWDVQRGVATWSDEMKQIWGLDPAEHVADVVLSATRRVHPDDRVLLESAMQSALTADATPVEFRILRPDGAERSILAVPGVARRDADGRLVSMSGIVQDVTAAREASAASARLLERLTHAQQLESVGRLAGGVAHEFNNKLAVILGNIEFAMAAVDPASPVYADLLAVRDAAQHSADLTRQLLAFARRETISPVVLDLNETVNSSLQMLRPLLGADIAVTWRPAEALWRVKADASQLAQVLTLLCVNARDAIADVGVVAVSTSNRVVDAAFVAAHDGAIAGSFACLTVRDTGCGMTPDVMQHIFEPFYTTKGLAEGTGLGLATVYGAVSQNGGFVLVQSEPGVGTTFDVFLPRHIG